MKINDDLFILKNEENYILYLPLKSTSAVVNSDTIKLLNAIDKGENVDPNNEIVQKLKEIGVFESSVYPFKDTLYKPTDVTFLPSFICNLECIYCYSNGGDFVTNKISINTAIIAIEFIIKNALELTKKHISIGFHGGGEPLLYANKHFIEKVIEFTKQKASKAGLNCQFSAVTNGVDIERFNIAWLKTNFSRISISLDGPPDIQNYQRPKRGHNKDSYTHTLNTINLFEQNNISYGIRATITKYSVNRMDEIVEHFCKISKQNNFHLEPLFECGRCKTSKIEAPSEEEFIANYSKAEKVAKKNGVKITYSGIGINTISDKFCGAAGDNFFITPDSFVTTCLEACRLDDNDNAPFFIGKYDEINAKFQFDQSKIDFLKSRRVTGMKSCDNCFCKFSCSGDCLAKVLKSTGDMFDTSNNKRCKITTALTEEIIKDSIC
ncbi:radical SAM protein [Ferruginibacter sp.]|nr:radical SAM protein [Ferruginibacter sp.]